MTPEPCRFCGVVNAAGSRYCRRCGRALPGPIGVPLGGRFTALRFQVDPVWPPPRRDIRYVLIVLGVGLVIAGSLMLGISAVVAGALSVGCAGPVCGSAGPSGWLEWLGIPMLVVGVVLAGLGLWWALRPAQLER